LFAEALEALYPGVKFGIGPPIDNGFYYDVDLGDKTFGEDDLAKVEAKMSELAKRNSVFVRRDVPKAEAIAYFEKKGDPFGTSIEFTGEKKFGFTSQGEKSLY
jgi:threonyl-tRNA synthetase